MKKYKGHGPPKNSNEEFNSTIAAALCTTGAGGQESTFDDNGISPLGQGMNSATTLP